MMKNDDYRTEFEEQRQEINMNEDHNGEILSRVELHRKGRKEKKRSGPKLINILFGLFTLIPVGILIFVIFSWNSPKLEPTNKVEDTQFQFETSGKSSGKVNVVEEDDEKESKEDLAKKEAEEQARKEQEEQARKAEEEKQARIAQEEQAKKDEAIAAAAAAAAQKEREEQAKKLEQEKKAEQKEQTTPKTHTVAAGETLYRISVKYYKSGDGVPKIMQANGLSSNEIATGQTLVIP